jgi:hypothetical protein
MTKFVGVRKDAKNDIINKIIMKKKGGIKVPACYLIVC